jgi:thiamine biosynthesis lipoprotein
VLDLGAVAKGLAIDMAARALESLGDYAIDAGGDLFVAGRNEAGELWSVGIRHPRLHDRMIETMRVSDCAVCTSGDYERRGTSGEAHIVDPRSGSTGLEAGRSDSIASVTVIAKSAMLADALATAAFVLGLDEGLRLLERAGVAGVLYSTSLERRATQDFPGA